jgi:hypothetical protein
MRHFRIEAVGAGLAIATGILVFMMVGFLFPLFGMIEIFGFFSSDPIAGPLIGVGLSGVLYSIAIIAIGLSGFTARSGAESGLSPALRSGICSDPGTRPYR